MSAAMLVRMACVDDLPQVLALERAIADAPHWIDAAYRDYVFPPAAALQCKALFVAGAQGCISGFAAASFVAGEAELESIAVAEAARRAGWGSQLLLAIEDWAEQQGARRLLLEVRSGNARARAFYAARGFVGEGLRRGYYNNPVDDAVLMWLKLAERHGSQEPTAEEL